MSNRPMPEKPDVNVTRRSFPSNSKSQQAKKRETEAKEKAEQAPAMEPVVKTVGRKKRSMGNKIHRFVFSEETNRIIDHALQDVIIPNVKSIIFDSIMGSLSIGLFGDVVKGSARRYGGHTRRNSQSNSRPTYGRSERKELSRRARANHDFDEITFKNRWEAEDVLESLQHRIDAYGRVTVADLLTACNETPNYADRNYGWTSLGGASITRDGPEWVIIFPRTEVL